MRHIRGYLFVIIAVCGWATIGLFYRVLIERWAFEREVIVAYRAGLAAVLLLVGLAWRRPQLLRVQWRDLPFFVGFGVLCVAGFYLIYIRAVQAGSVAQAAVLLYTAPFWIMGWSVLREGERLTMRKVAALLVAFVGCALVAGAYDRSQLRGNIGAIGWGLVSGLAYAVYSLGLRHGTRRGYSSWTVVTYTLLVGALVLCMVAPLEGLVRVWGLPQSWPYLLGTTVITSLIAPIAYTLSLTLLPASTAAIIATLEPVLAGVLAWLVLGERLALPQWLGVGCVFVAVASLALAEGRTAVVPANEPITNPTI